MAEDVSKPLPVRPLSEALDRDLRQIRALCILPGSRNDTIRCEFRIIALEHQNAEFEALSYVWGTQDSPEPIDLNGRPWSVKANLFAALRHLRASDRQRVIWIDALCINQSDEIEKSWQILLMRDIYSRASAVIVWLGESKQTSLALRILEEISTLDNPHWGQGYASRRPRETHVYTHLLGYSPTFHQIHWPKSGGLHDELFGQAAMEKMKREFEPHETWPPPTHKLGPLTEQDLNDCLISFTQHQYWQRIWTLQEILLPDDTALLVTSDYTLKAEVLFEVLNSLKHHIGDCCVDYARTHSVYEASKGLISVAFCSRISFTALRREDDQEQALDKEQNSRRKKILGLDRWHAWVGARKATDPKDHVIGLLGLLEQDHHIEPNYTSSTQQLFLDATLACIKSREDLRVLELVSHTPKTTPGLPSWSVDWVSAESRALRLPPHLRELQMNLYDASKSQKAEYYSSPDQKAITLQGILLGKITGLVPPAGGIPKSDDIKSRSRLIEERLRLMGCKETLLDLEEDLKDKKEKRCEHLLTTAATLMQGTKVTLADWYDRAEGDKCLDVINQWVHEAEWRRDLGVSADGKLSHEWKDLEASLTAYTIFATSDGKLGSCAAVNTELACGDRVAVLYGLDMPALLRKVGGSDSDDAKGRGETIPESYGFLGAAYVHGLMDGEALDHLETEKATCKSEHLTLV